MEMAAITARIVRRRAQLPITLAGVITLPDV